jgi:signal transduction histidine kinase
VARRAGCRLLAELQPGLTAIAHADQLSQVMDDVLANALRFGAGRPVRLSACPQEAGHVRISVIDEGPGMSAEEAARIFTLFHKPRGKLEPGLGVGLWVAGRLVAAMGGRIWMQSNPGHGAHVHVMLAAPDAAEIATPG